MLILKKNKFKLTHFMNNFKFILIIFSLTIITQPLHPMRHTQVGLIPNLSNINQEEVTKLQYTTKKKYEKFKFLIHKGNVHIHIKQNSNGSCEGNWFYDNHKFPLNDPEQYFNSIKKLYQMPDHHEVESEIFN